MQFAEPYAALLALLAIPVLVTGLRRRRSGVRMADARGLLPVAPTPRTRLARWLPALGALSILLLAIAAAGPRKGEAKAAVPAQGIDIMVTLDASSSMETTLGLSGKTRLDGAKEVIQEFIKGRENDRIGLVLFQRLAVPLSPPTLDYRALDRIVADAKSGLVPDGTAIGLGLAESINLLSESTAASRIVILLTDGQHNEPSISPDEAAAVAKALRIKIYTIGVVTSAARVGGEVDEKLMGRIAESTGGRFFVADSVDSLKGVYDEIGRLETSAVGRERFERFTEYGPWFAIAAAAFIVMELLLAATWLRRSPA
jgi:Ca-activated chloride channel family protein